VIALALIALATGLAVIGAIVTARWLEMSTWRRSLRAYRLRLPGSLDVESVAGWLASVSALTHPPLWSLLPLPPVGIEVVASQRGIEHYLLVTEHAAESVLGGLRAALPGVRIEEASDYLSARPTSQIAAELGMTSRSRPLAQLRAQQVATAVLAGLQPLGAGELVRIQLIVTSGGTPKPVHTASPKPEDRFWSNYLLTGSQTADSEEVRALRLKQQEPLLQATLRVGVSARGKARARKLFGRVWPTLHGANAPGVRLVRRWLPSSVVAARLRERTYPVTTWPLLVNAAEAVALAGFPLGGVMLPGLSMHAARQLPAPPSLPTTGSVIGISNYPGMTDRLLALRREDRLRHAMVLGPTGSGKSVLLTRLILDDIAAGYGVVALDPKGDLVTDVLDRIQDADADRVVVLDASKRNQPIGFNPLAVGRSEEEQERAVDDVLHIFKSIWAAFWGPRSDQIMRAALATLTSSWAADGSAFTLAEIVPLLTSPAFRRSVTAGERLSASLRAFWALFDSWSDGERIQAIGPVLNKVEAFTSRTPIRLVLGQSRGLDLADVFSKRAVLLVSLAKGSLGTETANLLGSLLVSSLWQTTLARVAVPAEARRPVFAYIDEAQDVVRLPLALADILAQARGLGLGLTLAHQYLAQLPEAVKAAVLGTVRTQIVFATELDDARVLAPRFAPLTVEDLTGLDAYEVAMRPNVHGQTLSPVTGQTLPLSAPLRNGAELAAASRARFGTPRAEVERAISERIRVAVHGGRKLGREPRGGGV
jgi:hypothetical protein